MFYRKTYGFWSYVNPFHSAGIYLFKVNNRNTRTRCKIFSKLTIKTPERCNSRRSAVFIIKFEHIPHLFLIFLLLTLIKGSVRYIFAGLFFKSKGDHTGKNAFYFTSKALFILKKTKAWNFRYSNFMMLSNA